jgi:hypothetical protein
MKIFRLTYNHVAFKREEEIEGDEMFSAMITALREFHFKPDYDTLYKCTVPRLIVCIVTLRPIDMRTRWNSRSFFGIIIEFVRALNEDNRVKMLQPDTAYG